MRFRHGAWSTSGISGFGISRVCFVLFCRCDVVLPISNTSAIAETNKIPYACLLFTFLNARLQLRACLNVDTINFAIHDIHRGSYMSAHVLLNFLALKCEAYRAFYCFFAKERNLSLNHSSGFKIYLHKFST